MFILIEHGAVYTLDPRGAHSVPGACEKIVRVGAVDREAILATGLPYAVINADGWAVIPDLIDPHERLIGAGG